MRRDPLERLSIRAALMLGFGLVLGLWIFTGWAFTRHLSDSEEQASAVTARYMRAQDLLTSVRSQLNVSSIVLRDALLDPTPDARAGYMARLETSYAAIDAAIDTYEPVVAQPEATASIEQLRGEIANFRRATLEALRDDAGGASRIALLRDAIAPRRAAALALSDDIRALNRRAFVQHQNATAAIHREAEQQWWQQLGLGLALTIAIGLAGVFYAGRLEDRLRQQRERDQESARELQLLSARLVAAQEEERRTIARELHDEVGQVLSTIKMDLMLAQRAIEQQGVSAEALEELQGMTDAALQTVRDLSQLLRPAVLDDLGLAAAVDGLLRGLARRHQVQVALVQDGQTERLATDTEVAAFRVIQEALTNVARHAAASSCTVRLSGSADALVITVEDDGCGFDPAAPRRARRGLGLVGLRERVAERGGTIEIDTAPGRGTRVVVELPAVRRPPAADAEEAEAQFGAPAHPASVPHG